MQSQRGEEAEGPSFVILMKKKEKKVKKFDPTRHQKKGKIRQRVGSATCHCHSYRPRAERRQFFPLLRANLVVILPDVDERSDSGYGENIR